MFIERSKLHNIADRITSWLAADGFECLDLEWEASTRTLRVFVDHAKGVGLDECAAVSSKLVEMEELDQLIPCEFSLEVSSPGIERPLRTLEHFKGAMTAHSQIDVKLVDKVNNRRKGVGSITAIEADVITMKTSEGIWTFPWDKVLKATQLADWDAVTRNAKEPVS